jgi:dihydrolipoamide dehydrogenase
VTVVHGTARFTGGHTLEVQTPEGTRSLDFKQCIIAAGSESVRLPGFPDDPRVIDSTGALELPPECKRLLVIGGGIIGLEMACVYDALGARVTVVELSDGLMPGTDRDLVKPLQKRIEKRYERLLLKTKVARLEALETGLRATFDGPDAPAPQEFDRVLATRIGQHLAARQEDRMQLADRFSIAGGMNIDQHLVAGFDVGRIPTPAAHHVGARAHQRPILVGAIGLSDDQCEPGMRVGPFPLTYGTAQRRQLRTVEQRE